MYAILYGMVNLIAQKSWRENVGRKKEEEGPIRKGMRIKHRIWGFVPFFTCSPHLSHDITTYSSDECWEREVVQINMYTEGALSFYDGVSSLFLGG